MYLSTLLINTGDNPDRPDWSITRRWLRNLYRVHQRLSMAFPSRAASNCAPQPNPARMSHDSAVPTGSEETDGRQARNAAHSFLFRVDLPVDSKRGVRTPVILVQSHHKPDWDYAFGLTPGKTDARRRPIGNAGFLLAEPPQVNEFRLELDADALLICRPSDCLRVKSGDLIRFLLRANPTRKAQDGSPNGKRRRIAPTFDEHAQWLSRKFGSAADLLGIDKFVTSWAYGWRTKYEPQPNQRMQWWSVLFEGTARVKHPPALKGLLESGIGSAKAFGFGLLSIKPLPQEAAAISPPG